MSQALAIGMVDPEFVNLIQKVSDLVHKISGNRLGDKQAYMVETRIKKRMMELNLKKPSEYIQYIDTYLTKESAVLVGLITTHHTFFFREFIHFEILKERLPDIVKEVKKRADKTLRVWSAACSRGQECYSLAMFLQYHLGQIDPSIQFKILGTDIDEESVKIANNGVYHYDEIKEVPMNYLGQNWARGTGEISMYAKIKAPLKSKCEFKPGNLLKIQETVGEQKFDLIFCRNVFIYFEAEQVKTISMNLLNKLYDHGIFFSGVSEPLSGYKLDIHAAGPSAYCKRAPIAAVEKEAPRFSTTPSFTPSMAPTPVAASPLRVMCVDDSASILTLLKRILTAEHGFEVVATAANGKEAIEKLKTTKVDLMTLDIHMPEMDGISYLKMNYNKMHPPVMMISSASRADSSTAMEAFKFGASDYVEKPVLADIVERGEEIRTKLRTMASLSNRKTEITSFDKENARNFIMTSPENKMRLMFGTLADLKSFKQFFGELPANQPPTIVFFEGVGEIMEDFVKANQLEFRKTVEMYKDGMMALQSDRIYFADVKKHFNSILMQHGSKKTSILAFGSTSAHTAGLIQQWRGAEVIIEDMNEEYNKKHPLKSVANEIVPVTSYSYISCRFLSK